MDILAVKQFYAGRQVGCQAVVVRAGACTGIEQLLLLSSAVRIQKPILETGFFYILNGLKIRDLKCILRSIFAVNYFFSLLSLE